MHQSIINSFEDFQQGEISENRLKQALLEHIYLWAQKRAEIGPEKAGEFALLLLGRLSRLIQGYDPGKGNLISYLTTCYKNHIKYVFARDHYKKTTEEALTFQFPKEPFWGYLQDPTTDYGVKRRNFDLWLRACRERIAQLSAPRQSIARRRLLCLFLYHGVYLPEHRLEDIADICHVDLALFKKWLNELLEEIKGRLSRLRDIRERLNKSYCGLKTYQWMDVKGGNLVNQEEIKKKILYYQARVNTNRQKLREIQLNTSQASIARIIRMPKGTVSSSIYYARKLLSPLSSELFSL